MFMQGRHLAIISEGLYYEVQQVLDGRRKKQRTKTVVDDMLPLRGFLVCPKCGKMLTGSASKGHTKHYHYYHCVSSCGSRYKADKANEQFATEIKNISPVQLSGKYANKLFSLPSNLKQKPTTTRGNNF